MAHHTRCFAVAPSVARLAGKRFCFQWRGHKILDQDDRHVANLSTDICSKEGGTTTKDRIKFAFKHSLARNPTDQEIEVLEKIFDSEHKTFQKQPEEAKKLISVGDTPVDQKIDAAEVAAWTIISNLIFNLDEFVTRG